MIVAVLLIGLPVVLAADVVRDVMAKRLIMFIAAEFLHTVRITPSATAAGWTPRRGAVGAGVAAVGPGMEKLPA